MNKYPVVSEAEAILQAATVVPNMVDQLNRLSLFSAQTRWREQDHFIQ